MANILSTGQITIVDIGDSLVLDAYISSSMQSTQVYDSSDKTYSPSYSKSEHGNILTLHVEGSGSSTSYLDNIVGDVTWYRVINGNKEEVKSISEQWSLYKTGDKNHKLVVKQDIPLNTRTMEYIATGTVLDEATGLTSPFRASITFTVVETGGSVSMLNVYGGEGVVFKNDVPSFLTIKADYYHNGNLTSRQRAYKFFAEDSSVNSSSHPRYDVDGGIGWRKILINDSYEKPSDDFGLYTYDDGVLKVYPQAVTNYQRYKVVCIVDDKKYSGNVILFDYSDPVTLYIESSSGLVFKNGVGETTLTARVYKNGDEQDIDGLYFEYRWYRRDHEGSLVSNFGGNGKDYKTGKKLTVKAGHMNNTNVYICELHRK